MSAHRWRNGGGYSFPPPTPYGYPNYYTHNNPTYSHAHATPHPQHHPNLLASQPPNRWTSQYQHWTLPVQPFIPLPVQHVRPATSWTGQATFTQFPNYLSRPPVVQTSHRIPEKWSPALAVKRKHHPCNTSKNIQVPEPKQVPGNTACTSAPPMAVNQPVKEKIQWPKPDIELVVKNSSSPINETHDSISEASSRKRKRKNNKIKKVKKEPPIQYYNKHMVRDPWFYLKPVVGIIVKKCVIDSVLENKTKCEGGVKVDCSKMSLADCIEMAFEETVTGTGHDKHVISML